jgi:hypothetical protein
VCNGTQADGGYAGVLGELQQCIERRTEQQLSRTLLLSCCHMLTSTCCSCCSGMRFSATRRADRCSCVTAAALSHTASAPICCCLLMCQSSGVYADMCLQLQIPLTLHYCFVCMLAILQELPYLLRQVTRCHVP